jgi:hypothetical protein
LGLESHSRAVQVQGLREVQVPELAEAWGPVPVLAAEGSDEPEY